jgi:membrane associated rhomboid family serine protease
MSSTSTPPAQNPVLTAYEGFCRETPLVTRAVLIVQFATFLLSYLVDLTYAIANTPNFTIFHYEVYRILLSPFICTSFLSLVFAYLSFGDNGRRLEFSMGSSAYVVLLLTIGVLTNLLHLAVFMTFYFLTNNEVYLFTKSYGIWIILFGIISIECAQAPQNSMRKLFFFTVPAIYFPILLLLLFSVFGGLQVPYVLSMGIGYAYGRGMLDCLKASRARCSQLENTLFSTISLQDGWIVSNDAVGNSAWQEAENTTDGLGVFSRLKPQNAQHGKEATTAPSPGEPRAGRVIKRNASHEKSFPSGGGRQLGTASKMASHVDPREARLKAIERRNQEGGDGQV